MTFGRCFSSLFAVLGLPNFHNYLVKSGIPLTHERAHLRRGTAHSVGELTLGAGGQQQAAHGRVTAECGEMQRGVLIFVLSRVDVGTLSDGIKEE